MPIFETMQLKRYVLVINFLVLAAMQCAFAQADSIVVRNKWCSKKDSLLLFYEGNNTIEVFGKGVKPTDIKLKSLDRSLRIGLPEMKGDTLMVLAMPFKGKAKQMRLAILSAKTMKPLKTVEFTADDIPDPIVKLGTIESSEATREVIQRQTKLRMMFPNSLYSYPYHIKQFTFRTSIPRGQVNLPVNGVFLTNNILRAVAETPEGDTITFANIQVTCPECSTRVLQDLKIRIKPTTDTVKGAKNTSK